MTSVTIYQLKATGTYSKRKGTVSSKSPLVVKDLRDRQTHSLTGSPLGTLRRLSLLDKCDSIEEFRQKGPPLPSTEPRDEQFIMVEQGNQWPIGLDQIHPAAKAWHQAALHEEAYQQASDNAARDQAATPLNRMGFIGVIGIAAILTVILGFVVVFSLMGGEGVGPMGTVPGGATWHL